MSNFFNRANNLKLGLQALNLTAFTVATISLIENPSKLSENGLAMLVHAMNFISLSENADYFGRLISSQLNIFRLGAIYAGVTSGNSGMPLVINTINAMNHLVTAVALFTNTDEENRREALSSVRLG